MRIFVMLSATKQVTKNFKKMTVSNTKPTIEERINNDLLFDVLQLNTQQASNILGGVNLSKQYQTAIYAPDKNKLLHLAGSNYKLISNMELYENAKNEMVNLFGSNGFKFNFVNEDDRRFFMRFTIKDDSKFDVNVGDVIETVITFKNSYDGNMKLSASIGFNRLVCSNGMTAYELNNNIQILKHSKNASEFDFSGIRTSLSVMDVQIFKYKKLQERFLTYNEITDFIEKAGKSKEREAFPKGLLKDVFPIVERESSLLNTAPNAWLLYNAFNYHINHNVKIGLDLKSKEKMDSLIYEDIQSTFY